jgi:hypothetical protein
MQECLLCMRVVWLEDVFCGTVEVHGVDEDGTLKDLTPCSEKTLQFFNHSSITKHLVLRCNLFKMAAYRHDRSLQMIAIFSILFATASASSSWIQKPLLQLQHTAPLKCSPVVQENIPESYGVLLLPDYTLEQHFDTIQVNLTDNIWWTFWFDKGFQGYAVRDVNTTLLNIIRKDPDVQRVWCDTRLELHDPIFEHRRDSSHHWYSEIMEWIMNR